MFKVTSKNRLAARRILGAWHEPAAVRSWPLADLQRSLETAIRQDLITTEAVNRALYEEEQLGNPEADDLEGSPGREDGPTVDGEGTADDEQDADSQDGDSKDGAEGEVESESDGDMPPQPQPHESEQPFVTHPEAEEMRLEDRAWVELSIEAATKNIADSKLAKRALDVATEANTQAKVVDKKLSKLQKSVDEKRVTTVRVEMPDSDTIEIDGAHYLLPEVIRVLSAGQNVALVGPAGCGKSYMVRQACEALKKEFRGANALQSKYDLIGYKDANGEYHDTPFYQAYTEGHLFCFDELDGSVPEAVVAFNSGVDGQPQFSFPNGLQDKHDGFIAVACMNTFGKGADADYVGRYRQDAASMDRFVFLEMDYDKAIERQLADDDIVERVHNLRLAFNELSIRQVMSTRAIIKAQACRDAGMSDKDISRHVFYAGLPMDTVEMIERHIAGMGS